MAQLICQDLCVGYDGKAVLQDLNFAVFSGDYLCIVGENGSGKSTLMKTILGLQQPVRGRILTLDGLRKNEIGYLPQQTQVQKDFPASVREIVLSGCQGRCGSRPFYNKEEKQLAADAMEKMFISRYPTASAPTEIMAIAASPLIFVFCPVRRSSTALRIVTAIPSGISMGSCSTAAIAIAPHATWASPSPMKEKRLSTSVTPSSGAHRAISTTTTTE